MKVTKERIFVYLRKLLPYLVIFAFTCLPLYVFFASNGMVEGDDSVWHRLELTDLAYGFENGFTGLSTGHNFLSFLSVNVYGFYGPFPHYFIVILYEMFKWAGASLVGTLKFSLFLFCYLSNVFVYLLAIRITGSRNVGLLSALVYNFLPYKMFCILVRAAYPEADALCFIPMVFYGVYRIVHDKEYRVAPYVVIGVSSACLVLSHPLTALVTASACVAYLLVNCVKVVHLAKDWKRDVSFGVMVLLTVGLVSPYVFTAINNETSGLYTISDRFVMGTDYDSLASAISRLSNTYSGFLAWDWLGSLNGLLKVDSVWSTAFSVGLLAVSGAATILLDNYFKTLKKQEYWRYLADAALLFVPAAIFQVRIEVWLAFVAFYFALVEMDLFKEDVFVNDIARTTPKDLIKNVDVYFLVVSLIILASLIYVPELWKAIPEAFYNIQFPYRLWGIFGFFVVFLLMYLFHLWREKPAYLNGIALVGALLFSLCAGPLDKRININYHGEGFWSDATVEEVQDTHRVGWQNEYLPIEYSDSSTYQSKYSNSLYYVIKSHLGYDTGSAFPSKDHYYAPVCLEGAGITNVTSVNSPNVTFVLNLATDNGLVQIPQFYYDGYKIEMLSADKNVWTSPQAENVDGLVSFHVEDKGVYSVKVTYVGPATYRVGRVFFYLSVVGFVGLGIGGYFLAKGEKKKKPLETLPVS